MNIWVLLNAFLMCSQQHYLNPQLVKQDLDKQIQRERRNLKETPNYLGQPWKPIRVKFEYLDPTVTPLSSYIDKVLKVAQVFLGRHLLVNRPSFPLSFGTSDPTCLRHQISQTIGRKQYSDADIVFFVALESDSTEQYIAYAGPCRIDLISNRSIFGLISWNLDYVNVVIFYSRPNLQFQDHITNIRFERDVETAIHELIHGLGFIQVYYDFYHDSVTWKPYEDYYSYDTQGHLILQTPRLANVTKYHFQCETAKGAKMEQQGDRGTSGSHFERSLYFNELMTGSEMNGDFLITDFTFMLLQDTGQETMFYRMAGYTPDPIFFGKQKGCPFYDSTCQANEDFLEFCRQVSVTSCSFSNTGIAICQSDELGDGCFFKKIYPHFDCRDSNSYVGLDSQIQNYVNIAFNKFGYDTACFEGGVALQTNSQLLNLGFSCYQYKCQNNELIVSVNDTSFVCDQASKVITVSQGDYSGKIICPNQIRTFCQDVIECKDQCGQRGFCMAGKVV